MEEKGGFVSREDLMRGEGIKRCQQSEMPVGFNPRKIQLGAACAAVPRPSMQIVGTAG